MSGRKVQLIVVSGLSGSGKSATLKCFEDGGFFCVDNLPPQLIPKFTELCAQPGSDVSRVALGIDIRNREFLDTFLAVRESLLQEGFPMTLLFMDTRDAVLVRRFSESRRPHPLAREGMILEQIILEEREKLADLKHQADEVIDTSDISLFQLKETILCRYFGQETGKRLQVILLSFGFKFGLPYGLDLLFDMRFLKNPYFQSDLRSLTGKDKAVYDFVMALPEADLFLKKLLDFLDFLIPLYQREGKSYLTLGIGCTGGRHRSVAVVQKLYEVLQERVSSHGLSFFHRDVHRPLGE